MVDKYINSYSDTCSFVRLRECFTLRALSLGARANYDDGLRKLRAFAVDKNIG